MNTRLLAKLLYRDCDPRIDFPAAMGWRGTDPTPHIPEREISLPAARPYPSGLIASGGGATGGSPVEKWFAIVELLLTDLDDHLSKQESFIVLEPFRPTTV